MTAKCERPRRPRRSRNTARSSPGVFAATALGRSSSRARSHVARSNAGSKCVSRTIVQTLSNVAAASGACADSGSTDAAVRSSAASLHVTRTTDLTAYASLQLRSLYEGLDLLRKIERARRHLVELDGRNRDLLLDAHDLLDHARRQQEIAELLVVPFDAGRLHRTHRRFARIHAAGPKPGGEVVEIEVLRPILAHHADLIAGLVVERGLLHRLHAAIPRRIAQVAVEVRIEFRLLQLLADLEHRSEQRRE